MQTEANTVLLRREVLVRMIKAFLSGDLQQKADGMPLEMRPTDGDVPFRKDVDTERAVIREAEIAALGGSVEEDTDKTSVCAYVKQAMERQQPDNTVLTVLESACHGCGPRRIFVTNLCQGCVDRSCTKACAFGAISFKDGHSVIDNTKCKSCTKCMQVCPYSAIVQVKVPCEDACPVGAISKNERGRAHIDSSRCLTCGACKAACPFGAVAEKSQLIDILRAIKSDKKVVAMMAPAVAGQVSVNVGKVASALVKAGFDIVMEAAVGADITTRNETAEFAERMERGDKFMTTSCCAAYREMVKKTVPEIKKFMSDTGTPMHYTAELAKQKYPGCVTVFVGPCVAKRSEGLGDENVDYVMGFEELTALFEACEIDINACDDYAFDIETSKHGRNFAISGGVAESVRFLGEGKVEVRPTCINGMTPKSVREMAMWAKKGECPLGNLVEVMVCEGGCVAGAACINNKKVAARNVMAYADKGENLTEK